MNQPKRSLPRLVVAGGIFIIVCISTSVVGPKITVQPFKVSEDVVWVSNGVHYLTGPQISERITEINAPQELLLKEDIEKSTPTCEAVENGFCNQGGDTYAHKAQVAPAVLHKPATPDIKRVVGYCTLCRDGTFSPSCAVGRGACSWHSGVAQYNAAEYRTTPGSPEVPARPAEYSYTPESYTESASYVEVAQPSLNTIVTFVSQH